MNDSASGSVAKQPDWETTNAEFRMSSPMALGGRSTSASPTYR